MKISSYKKIRVGKRLFFSPDEREKNEYLNMKKEIDLKYGLSIPSRDEIIKQLIAFLTDGDLERYKREPVDLLIIKTDIKNFFPSINNHNLYKKLIKSNILHTDTLSKLKPIFFSKKIRGIPLGLPISNSLAEIYLEDFKDLIFKNVRPDFYARYVDDIIIIKYIPKRSNPKILEEEYSHKLIDIFNTTNIEINHNKTTYKIVDHTNFKNEITFIFLGYEFIIQKYSLKVSISKNKIIKIENTLKDHFYMYRKSNKSKKEFWKLYYKLVNTLYGVTTDDKNKVKRRFGLGYNYKFINEGIKVYKLIILCQEEIFKLNLKSYQKHTLLSILSYKIFDNKRVKNERVKNEEEALKFLKNRFDYTKISLNQKSLFSNRLYINENQNINSAKIFYNIYGKNKF